MTDATPIEPYVPLSTSRIWELQRRYYATQGPRAWLSDQVPHYITGNALVASAYARVFAAYIEDLLALDPDHPAACIDRERPIDVVELGSGAGRLAFLLARELDALRQERDLPRFRVILTDFTQANVDACAARPELRRLAEDGLVDFALFDAEDPAPLTLHHSGEILGDAPTANPLLIVANYVFDTLPQDAFAVRDGRVLALHHRASLPPDHPDDAPDAAAHLSLHARPAPIDLPHYQDPLLDGLLARYRDGLRDTQVLIPTIALRALGWLLDRSQGRGCLIAGDKGYRRLSDLERRKVGAPAQHGSFSFMVNFDALAALAEHRGGEALTARTRYTRFTVGAFSFTGGQPVALPRWRGAYADRIDRFGPAEYHRFYQLVRQQEQPPSLPTLLILLRLSCYDPVLFDRYGAHILAQFDGAGRAVQHDLLGAIDEVIARSYPVGRHDDTLFLAARMLSAMGRRAEATAVFERVTREQPTRRAGWYNLGIWLEAQGDLPGARASFERALTIDPDYARALDAMKRLDEAS